MRYVYKHQLIKSHPRNKMFVYENEKYRYAVLRSNGLETYHNTILDAKKYIDALFETGENKEKR